MSKGIAQTMTRENNEIFPGQTWPSLILKRGDPVNSAREFCKHHQRPLVYWRNDFYEWVGQKYRVLSEGAVKAEIYSCLDRAKVMTSSGELTPFYPNIRSVQEVFFASRCLEGQTLMSDRVDAPCWLGSRGNKPDAKRLVALQNEVVDLETGETFPHSPEFFTTTALPFDYDPKADCPRWKQFVKELFPDESARREFQKAVGYMLSSDRQMQKVFLVIGPRRAGKGTIMGTMVALLGRENTVSPDLSELQEHFGKEQLINKKAAFFTDERLRGNTSQIVPWLLKLSGEDDVSIPRKHRQNWHGRPDVRLWISTNETPMFDDASGVIASRFIVFRLTQSFYGKEDVGLTAKLLTELPGIFNWACEGLKLIREDGTFHQSATTLEDMRRIRNIASPALAFVGEKLTLFEGRYVEREELYKIYVEWCQKNGHKPQSCAKLINTLIDEYPGQLKEGRAGPRGAQVPVLRGMDWLHAGAFEVPENDDLMSVTWKAAA